MYFCGNARARGAFHNRSPPVPDFSLPHRRGNGNSNMAARNGGQKTEGSDRMNGGKRKNFPAHIARGVLLLLLCGALCQPASAAARGAAEASRSVRAVVPVGQTVGIKMHSEGLLIAELSEVGGKPSPAGEAGLRAGDFIVSANGKALSNAEELREAAAGSGGEALRLACRRDGKSVNADVRPARDGDGVYRLGAWVRDSMAGIGTVTFYDEESGVFGALGHGITDSDTSALMPLSYGSIMPGTVTEVKKGAAGSPGRLNGDIGADSEIGSITSNTDFGIFGTAKSALGDGKAVPAGDAHRGAATILSTVDGSGAKEYAIEIVKLMPDAADGRDMLIRVTDAELIAKTGGIVQGMSGSPILQNGKIVGAVTHVLVNNPKEGYGILISHMLGEVFPNTTENAS